MRSLPWWACESYVGDFCLAFKRDCMSNTKTKLHAISWCATGLAQDFATILWTLSFATQMWWLRSSCQPNFVQDMTAKSGFLPMWQSQRDWEMVPQLERALHCNEIWFFLLLLVRFAELHVRNLTGSLSFFCVIYWYRIMFQTMWCDATKTMWSCMYTLMVSSWRSWESLGGSWSNVVEVLWVSWEVLGSHEGVLEESWESLGRSLGEVLLVLEMSERQILHNRVLDICNVLQHRMCNIAFVFFVCKWQLMQALHFMIAFSKHFEILHTLTSSS